MHSSLSRFPDHPSRSKLRGIQFKNKVKAFHEYLSGAAGPGQ
jgi:hypothetical protein